MLPSFYIQLFNTLGNLIEISLIGLIAYLTYKNNKALVERSSNINIKLDRLITLTDPLKRIVDSDLQETKVIRRQTSS